MFNLTEHQRHLVQSSFQVIIEDVDATAEKFYDHLFALDPALRTMFRDDMRIQGRKLITMFVTLVNGLNDPNRLISELNRLGERHSAYGVERAHFPLVGQALIYTLQETLGSSFTVETEAAWKTTYEALEAIIVSSMYPDTHA